MNNLFIIRSIKTNINTGSFDRLNLQEPELKQLSINDLTLLTTSFWLSSLDLSHQLHFIIALQSDAIYRDQTLQKLKSWILSGNVFIHIQLVLRKRIKFMFTFNKIGTCYIRILRTNGFDSILCCFYLITK